MRGRTGVHVESPLPTESASPLPRDLQLSGWLDLLKLEYDHGAERYENIYRAIWQNFSYMAILSAAILTFAGKQFDYAFTRFLVLLPIVLWFFSTYLPLNAYGEDLRTRLAEMEEAINRVYFPRVDDPRLKHFREFRAAKRFRWHVKYGVWVAGALALVLCASGLWTSYFSERPSQSNSPVSASVADSAVVTIPLRQLVRERDSLHHLEARINHLQPQIWLQQHLLDSLHSLR